MATFADQYRKATPTVTPSGGASFGSKYRKSTPPPTSRTEVIAAPAPSRFTLNPMSPPPNQLLTSFQAPQVAEASSQDVIIPEGIKTFEGIVRDPLNLKGEPKQVFHKMWDALKDPIVAEGQAIKDLFNARSAVDTTAAYTKGLAAAGGILFSPISALFEGANQIPVLGSISKLISVPFQLIGEAGTGLSNELIDTLPISPEAKQKIAPGIGEIFALAGQIAIGGAFSGKAKVAELKKKGFSARDAETIVKQAEEIGTQKKVKNILEQPEPIPVEAPVRAQKAPGRDVDVRVDEFSGAPIRTIPIEQIRPSSRGMVKQETIDAVVKDGQINRPIELKKEADGTYSIVDGFNRIEGAKQLGLKDLPSILQTERPSLAEFAAQGEIKARGLSKNIETKAIESGLTKGFGELPEYREVKMADQARLAQDLITKDAEFARRVAMGEEAAPKGIIPEAVLVAVENRAIKAGDVATLRDLATKSTLTAEATGMGQRIRTLGERNPDSPVGAIAEIKQARESKTKDPNKVRKSTVKEIKEEIQKKTPTKKDWSSFVESITC